MDNTNAMPPPNAAERPGPSDWMSKYGAVCDGDYVTLRNNAWGGTTVKHSWGDDNAGGGTLVSADKTPNQKTYGSAPAPLSLGKVAMYNRYSFVIRRVVFSAEKKAWVLPSWHAWKDRRPLALSDKVVFLCPNDPLLVLGTRNPGSYGNNGDYRVGLVEFPLATSDELVGSTTSGHLLRIVTYGLWRSDKNGVDFLNQSRCVWTFHNSLKGGANLLYGASPVNIRNMWTEMKAKETSLWELVGPLAITGINTAISRTFNGGRNLTQAAGSGGATVKLALTNKDRDDKALWVIDAWHGNRYPVQRALIPSQPPPSENPDEGGEVDPEREEEEKTSVPDLQEQIRDPPRGIPGMRLDPDTGTPLPSSLESGTQRQNEITSIGWFVKLITGKRWQDLSYLQQLIIVGGLALTLLIVVNDLSKGVIKKVFD